MTTFPLQAVFNRGELTPILHSRVDLEYFRNCYKYGENFILTRHGGLMNRPGTKYLGMIKDQSKTARLVKFVFSRTQVYQIEFGHHYIRFWANDGQVILSSNPISNITQADPGVVTYTGADNFAEGDLVLLSGMTGMDQADGVEYVVGGLNVGANTFGLYGVASILLENGADSILLEDGSTLLMQSGSVDTTAFEAYVGGGFVFKLYEVTTTYDESELSELQFTQSNDVIYIAHKNHAPAKIQRFSETNWVLSDVVFVDGPYLPQLPFDVSPAAVNHSTDASPTWNSVEEIGGVVDEIGLFDKNEADGYTSDSSPPFDIRFDAGVGNSFVLNSYIVVTNGHHTDSPIQDFWETSSPKTWEIYASNDLVTFTRLDGRSFEVGWDRKEGRYYEFYNATAYRYYEFRLLDTPDDNAVRINEIYWGFNGDFAPTTTLTFSSVVGINNGAGFTVDDIGRHVSLLSSNDIKRRWFKITGITSPTVVTGRFYGFALRQGWHISSWALGAFSVASGYPAAVAFYIDRLVWARTNTRPMGLFLSQTGSYENHSINSPLLDDDAITINIASSETEEIIWLSEGVVDLVIGTSAAIRTMGKGDAGKPFSPSNFNVQRQTSNGSANVTPSLVGSALIYPSYHLKALREFLFSFEVDSYVSPEISILSDHLLKSGISLIDFAAAPEPILWVINGNGELIGLTYDKENKVVGLHRSRIGGRTGSNASYAVVESLSVVPGDSQDDAWCIVQREIDGETKRYVERVTEFIDETVPKEDAWYLDCAVEYEGVATNLITGLSHLKGETVSVYANNTVYAELVVSSLGKLNLPIGITATRALIGIPQSQYFDLLQPVMETPDGISFNRKKHSISMIIDFWRTKGIKIGTTRSQERVQYSENGSRTENPSELFTGSTKVRYDSRWDDMAACRVVQDKPYPAFVRSIMLINDGEP